MRRLILIRHAKSSHKHLGLDDHERPLNRRGERDAVAMARHIADKDEMLDVIFTSTAARAIDFAQLISEFSGVALEPDLSFYTFRADALLEILCNLPDNINRVAVVAHNPAITQVVNHLVGANLDNVPTAGAVAIDCHVDSWEGLRNTDCDMDYFDYPKMLQ